MCLVFEAVKNNDLKTLKEALKHDNSDEDLRGALRNAAELGLLPLVKCLVRAGVRDDWAVVAAASFASVKVVRYLCRCCGGNLNAALIGAAAHGRAENARFLLTAGAETFDEALADAVLRGYDDIAKLLLKRGADPFAPAAGLRRRWLPGGRTKRCFHCLNKRKKQNKKYLIGLLKFKRLFYNLINIFPNESR